MDEQKQPRSIEEIDQEYVKVAALLGDRHFKLLKLPEEIKALEQKLASLTQEAMLTQQVNLENQPS